MNKWLDSTVEAYIEHFGFSEAPVVWEVGSRDGHDGVELAERIYGGIEFWDDAKVVCLEPNPDQAKIIVENYSNVKLYMVAASNKGGKADFIVYEGDEGAVGSSSLNLNWKENDLSGHVIKVNRIRLEKLVRGEIDIMKVDVEGHSMEALEGLGDKIRQVKVFHIETEKWTESNIKMKIFMSNKGFTLVDEVEQYGGMPDQVWVRG